MREEDFHGFNDRAKSLYVGSEVQVTLFEHMSFAGRYLNFGNGTAARCLSEYSNTEANLNAISSSALFNVAHCYIINFRVNMQSYAEGHNHFFCHYKDNNYAVSIRDDSAVSDNKLIIIKTTVKGEQLQLFEGANFTGTSVIITESKTFESRASFGITKIGSYKIIRPSNY